MTKDERQQSLINARRACEWLEEYLGSSSQGVIGDLIASEYAIDLIAGFKLLDANASRPRAGRPRIKTDNPKTLAQRRWRAKQK